MTDEWKADGTSLLHNGKIVMSIIDGDLRISLGWLKESGFKGKVIIHKVWFDLTPVAVFEVEKDAVEPTRVEEIKKRPDACLYCSHFKGKIDEEKGKCDSRYMYGTCDWKDGGACPEFRLDKKVFPDTAQEEKTEAKPKVSSEEIERLEEELLK